MEETQLALNELFNLILDGMALRYVPVKEETMSHLIYVELDTDDAKVLLQRFGTGLSHAEHELCLAIQQALEDDDAEDI